MVNGMERSYQAARNAIERMYRGKATVYGFCGKTDQETGITSQEKEATVENLPCLLSFETLSRAQAGKAAAKPEQIIRLFASPETEISPGSRIRVKQDGRVTDYRMSGQPAVYPTHQEILLELLERWT